AAAVGLERHSSRAVERGIAVVVTRVVNVEDVAREVRPAILVKSRGDVLPVGFRPSARVFVQLGVDRQRPRREEKAVGISVMVYEHDWVKSMYFVHDTQSLALNKVSRVAVQVDLVMVVVGVHAPVAAV